MKCPKCQSENTQNLEVVFCGGTHNIVATSVGVAGGGNGGFGGVSSTRGQSQSVLAAACSPPIKKSETGPGMAVFLPLAMACLPIVFGHITKSSLLLSLGFAVVFSPVWGIGLYFLRSRAKYNKQIWPNLFKHWRESWLCHKCGSIYR